MELKPCPFCGESSHIIEHIEGTIIHPAYLVKCDNCGAQAPCTDKGTHVELWNKRADDLSAAHHLLWTFYTLSGRRVSHEFLCDHKNMTALEDSTEFLVGLGLAVDTGYSFKITKAGMELMGITSD